MVASGTGEKAELARMALDVYAHALKVGMGPQRRCGDGARHHKNGARQTTAGGKIMDGKRVNLDAEPSAIQRLSLAGLATA